MSCVSLLFCIFFRTFVFFLFRFRTRFVPFLGERERGTKGRRCEFRTQRLEVTDKEGTCSDSARFNGTRHSTFMDSRK